MEDREVKSSMLWRWVGRWRRSSVGRCRRDMFSGVKMEKMDVGCVSRGLLEVLEVYI